eukprot:1969569-Alexandrium_andersonii.AAC.1
MNGCAERAPREVLGASILRQPQQNILGQRLLYSSTCIAALQPAWSGWEHFLARPCLPDPLRKCVRRPSDALFGPPRGGRSKG